MNLVSLQLVFVHSFRSLIMFFNLSLEVYHLKLNSNSGVCWDCHVPCSRPRATMLQYSSGHHSCSVPCKWSTPGLCDVLALSECCAPDENLTMHYLWKQNRTTLELTTGSCLLSNERFYTYLKFNTLGNRTHCLRTLSKYYLSLSPKPVSPISEIHPVRCLCFKPSTYFTWTLSVPF